MRYALCEAVYLDSVRDSSFAGAGWEPPVMATDDVVAAAASFPVGRIPNSDNMAAKAAAKPVALSADGLVACSLMAGSTLSTVTAGPEGICREFSATRGGEEVEGAYKIWRTSITVWD